MSYNYNSEGTYLTNVNNSNSHEELEKNLFKSKLFKTNISLTDKDKTTKFGTTNPTNNNIPVITLDTQTHLSPLNVNSPNESRDPDAFTGDKIDEMTSQGLIGLSSDLNANFSEILLKSSYHNKQIKPYKSRVNNNSVLSKFREDLEKNKFIIDKQIERSLAIKVKHSEFYKKIKREQEEEKIRLELHRKMQFEQSSGNLNKNNIPNSISDSNDPSSNLLYSIKGPSNNGRCASMINVITIPSQMTVSESEGRRKNNTVVIPENTTAKILTADRNYLKKIEDLIQRSNKGNLSSQHVSNKNSISKIPKGKNNSRLNSPTGSEKSQERNLIRLSQESIKPVVYNRKKTFKIAFEANWFEKVGLPNKNFSNSLVNSVDDQSIFIVDEMRVLLDNLQFFKTHYLLSHDLLSVFRNMDSPIQAKYNKIIEETCGLMMEIPNIMLSDFNQFLEKFVAFKPPNVSRLKDKIVENEEENFISNCKLLSDNNLYLKSCFDVYNILIKQVDDMFIPQKTFNKLAQFMARARFNISALIMNFKNQIKKMKEDNKNIQKFYNRKSNTEEEVATEFNKNMTRKKPPLPKIIKSYKIKKSHPDGEYIKKQHMFKINDENQRISRLNGVLNHRNLDEAYYIQVKKKNNSHDSHKSLLNSNIMTKLLKYCPKSIKETILSERIIERFRLKNEEEKIVEEDDD